MYTPHWHRPNVTGKVKPKLMHKPTDLNQYDPIHS